MTGRIALSGLFLAGTALAGNALLTDWTASLNPLDESTVRGSATASPMPGDSLGDSLDVRIMIENARPGDTHPWHLHSGACPRSGGVLGGEGAYAAIGVAEDGTGSSTARVAVKLMEGGSYSVNVHRSAGDHTAISCGDLRPAGGRPKSP